MTSDSMMQFCPNEIDVVKIPTDIPEYDIEDYDLFDDKDKAKYIKDLERLVRNSIEYRQMVNYLREYMNMNSCSFMPAINNLTTYKIRIEIHHSPLTLFDICSIILAKRMSLGESTDIEQTAYEVLFVHYSLMVGLIPLSETVHELVHNQYITIPLNKVYGYYKTFINTYNQWIPEEMLFKLKQLEEYTETFKEDEYNQLLEKHYITVDMEDNDQLIKMKEAKDLTQSVLNQYKADTTTSYDITRPDNYNAQVRSINPFVKL